MVKEFNNFRIKEIKDELQYITFGDSSITFKIQDGPIKLHGKNGCQIDSLGIVWLCILKSFNNRFSSRFNTNSIKDIESALNWQSNRKRDRQLRNVEGYDRI